MYTVYTFAVCKLTFALVVLDICALLLTDILAQLGESKTEQRQSAQDRLARKRQLIADRQAAGLATDDALLEAIIEEEIQSSPKKKRVIVALKIAPACNRWRFIHVQSCRYMWVCMSQL